MTTTPTFTFHVDCIEEAHTGNENRPFFFTWYTTMTGSDGSVFSGNWCECVAEVSRRFPGVVFTEVWHESEPVMFVPCENAIRYVEDSECPFFWVAVE